MIAFSEYFFFVLFAAILLISLVLVGGRGSHSVVKGISAFLPPALLTSLVPRCALF